MELYIYVNLGFSIATFIGLILFSIFTIGSLENIGTKLSLQNLLPAPKKPKVSKKKAPKTEVKKEKVSAKNAVAVNAARDFQKIRSAEITIPVIAADVLVYGPGELGTAYPEETKLYYSPEALKDKEFLETVLSSPLQVQTHEKNTGEFNRDVDGWPREAWWDESEKRVKVKGFLLGEENVEYAKENQNKPNFGTSAFISFLKVDRESGVSPEGKPYDAIVRKAINNHIAILPNVRDPKNVILAMNALGDQEETEEKEEGKNNEPPKAEETKRMPIDKADFKEAMDAYMAEQKEDEAKKNAIKNEVLEEIKKGKDGENAKNEEDEAKKKAEEDAKNEEEAKKKEEEESASNALPSEEMVKDFSESLGLTFKKTPTLKELASLTGVTASNTAELVTALNAKRAELKKNESKEGEASNSKEESSIETFIRGI